MRAEVHKETDLSTANPNSGLVQFAPWSADTVDDIDAGRSFGSFTTIAGKMRIATSGSIGRGTAHSSEVVSLATLEVVAAAKIGAALAHPVVRRLCRRATARVALYSQRRPSVSATKQIDRVCVSSRLSISDRSRLLLCAFHHLRELEAFIKL